jgi:tetratricopeptide (TPR) repeat protein
MARGDIEELSWRISEYATTGRAGPIMDRDAAAAAARIVLSVSPGRHPRTTQALFLLAGWHLARFMAERQGSDWEAGLRLSALCAELDPTAVPVQVRALALDHRARHPGAALHPAPECGPVLVTCAAAHPDDDALLDLAIDVLDLAIRVGGDDEDRAITYANLAAALIRRFGRRPDERDLPAAVRAGRAGAALDSLSGPVRNMCLINLAAALEASFEATGDVGELTEAVAVTRAALADWPEPEPDPLRDAVRFDLSKKLFERFRVTGTLSDPVADIADTKRAAACLPVTDERRPTVACYLCGLLVARFDQTNDPADLDEAVAISEAALGRTPADHSSRPNLLLALGDALDKRAQVRHTVADLDRALELQRAATEVPAGRDQTQVNALLRYARSLRHRHRLGGGPVLLVRSIAAALDAVAHGPSRAQALGQLAESLEALYLSAAPGDDLDAVISIGREVSERDGVDAATRARAWACMSQAFWMRAEQTGARADLNAAVDWGVRAVAGAAGGDASVRALASLVQALSKRALLTGSTSDAEEAVRRAQQLAETPDLEDRNRSLVLANVASALLVLYSRTERMSTLSAAIGAYQRAWSLIGDSDQRALVLSNMGAAFRTRYARMYNGDDLDEAVRYGRLAVEALTASGGQRGSILSNLGSSLTMLCAAGGDREVLDEAIGVHRAAVAATGAEHADRAGRLSALARALRIRFESTRSADDLAEAITTYRAAMTVRSAGPAERGSAARSLGMLAADNQQWDTAVEGLSTAIGLLPQIAWLGIDRADRADRLTDWQGIAAAAAATALAAGDPHRAITLLEQGRSVLWNQDAQLRDEHAALAAASPGLSETLTALGRGLDQAVPDLTGRRPELADRWDTTVRQVRELPGFEDFLRPPSAHGLQRSIGSSPVIVVNVHPLRSDAIVLTRDSVTAIALPDLTHDELVRRIELYVIAAVRLELGRISRLDLINANQTLAATLEWLWDVLAEPVLRQLGHHGPPAAGAAWPGVTWCPVGSLALLPVHAAGYADEPGNAVLDRVVSSYTSSLLALTKSKRVREKRARPVLVVSVPDAAVDGLAGLPGARAEARMLAADFPDEIGEVLIGASATKDAVLRKLPQSDGVHFACHGSQRLEAPETGAIHLFDGAFTVMDVAALKLEHAEFAYLSACKTAVGGTELPDEAIHLVAALQLAGYRHVIGTLWTVDDRQAIEVARRTYELMGTPAGRFDFSASAVALHHAIRELRDAHPYEAGRWAFHVHFGPGSEAATDQLGPQRR